MLDLSQFDTKVKAPTGALMKVEDPRTGEPLFDEVEEDGQKVKKFVTLRLLGKDSDEYKRVTYKATDRKLDRQMKAVGTRRAPRITAQELEEDQLNILVACTTGWENVTLDGKRLEFSPENARALYERVPCVREQADTFISDRANFLGNS